MKKEQKTILAATIAATIVTTAATTAFCQASVPPVPPVPAASAAAEVEAEDGPENPESGAACYLYALGDRMEVSQAFDKILAGSLTPLASFPDARNKFGLENEKGARAHLAYWDGWMKVSKSGKRIFRLMDYGGHNTRRYRLIVNGKTYFQCTEGQDAVTVPLKAGYNRVQVLLFSYDAAACVQVFWKSEKSLKDFSNLTPANLVYDKSEDDE